MMGKFGQLIRKYRENAGMPLRKVAAYLDIDQAILSKIEWGHRKPKRALVEKLADFLQADKEELLTAWLTDKVLYEVQDEELAGKALMLAEKHVAYEAFRKIDREELINKMLSGVRQFPKIEKAWIYGSFARQDDRPGSDIDVAIKADPGVSYFDLAEIQHVLEQLTNRKVDLGFIDTFKPYILAHVQPDLRLIYER